MGVRAIRLSWGALTVSLVVLLAVAMLSALGVGQYPLTLPQVLQMLVSPLADGPRDAGDLPRTVLWQIRLPRVCASVAVGAALAASGVALQSVFRNPLAAPDLLGVSAGAALGAVAGIFLGWTVFAIQGEPSILQLCYNLMLKITGTACKKFIYACVPSIWFKSLQTKAR